MHSNPLAIRTTSGPRWAHPLAEPRPVLPVTIVVIIGWLSWLGWQPEQIVALLLVPGVVMAKTDGSVRDAG